MTANETKTITVPELLKKLDSSMNGLYSEEANNRLQPLARSIKKRRCQRGLPRSINKISIQLAE
jgi:hypothetical protein